MNPSSPPTSLLVLIVKDIARHWLRVLLFLLLLISASLVILSTHYYRQTNIAFEKLMQAQDSMDVEWRHLVLEQGTLSQHNRIESLVSKELDMRRPHSNDEILVRVK